MLKIYRNVLAAGVVALGLAACGDNVTVSNPTTTPIVHSVSVVPTSVTINMGQAGVTFVASVTADSGLSKAVNWSSTNIAVATISSSGVITTVAPGQTTIVATSVGDPTVFGAGSLTVVALPANISAFSVNPTNAQIAVGGTLQPSPSVTTIPGAPAAVITWATNNAAAATVNAATGQITGVANGTAVITATATSGTQTATATVGVTVGAGPTGVVSFSVSPSAVTLFAGQTQQVTATVVSPGFTYGVTYTTSAPSVATVSAGGLITAVAQGNAVINATIGTAPNTLTQSVVVTVGQAASISINSVTAAATAGNNNCAGTTGAPVILTDVNCQVDVNLNFQPGLQRIDSVTVWFIQGSTTHKLARQAYAATIPAAGILTLSVNTANFTKVPAKGTATVDLWNGPTTMVAQVWPTLGASGSATNCQIGAGNADPTCSNLSMIMNNADGWAGDVTKCSATIATGVTCPAAVTSVAAGVNTSTGGFAIDVNGSNINSGKTYWGGPGTSGEVAAELYAVVYDDNPGSPAGSSLNRCNNTLGDGSGCITTISWAIGSTSIPSGHCSYVSQSATVAPATPIFAQTFGTSGTGLTNNCGGHENLLARRDNILLTGPALDAQNNTYPTGGLIPNIVVNGATPDSFRLDWNGPSNIVAPQIQGAEGQNWVNKNWLFKPGGTLVSDAGVGPAPSSWTAFCANSGANCAQGGSSTYTVPIVTGNDAVMVETNTNGVDGYYARAVATDLLGNGGNSGVNSIFGVDRTAPLIRYSTTAAPSSYTFAGPVNPIYTGGGAGGSAGVFDSSTYNAYEGVIGANTGTVNGGNQDLFLTATAGTNDSFRVEAIDTRSGLRRITQGTNLFGQNSNNGIQGFSTTTFLPGTIDGWFPAQAMHILAGTGQTTPGYYTTTAYAVDKAGNVSGCPVSGSISGSVCTAALANTGSNTNPAMAGGNAPGELNQNLFVRRTLALDPGQPQITGVSPNANYLGNQPATFTLGAQNDLEVIDARLRVQYPNLSTGTVAEVVPVGTAGGLVWSYALSNSFMPSGNNAGPAAGAGAAFIGGANFGFFTPIAKRFDNSVINPVLQSFSLDMFTLNIQEPCTNATANFGGSPGTGFSTGMVTATACNGVSYVGDPIPTSGGGSIPLTKPANVGVQVRDVFGSWIFNSVAAAGTGVSGEFVSPILSATVAAPGGYGVSYFNPGSGQSCPAGGAVQPANSTSCVNGGINFRADLFYSTASTKVFRAVEPLSTSLPTFSRAELYGLNAAGEWVFISRIVVPNPVTVSAGCPAGTPPAGVVGCDNGLERYWLYTFTSVPTIPGGFTAYRAIGVNGSGYGLASTLD